MKYSGLDKAIALASKKFVDKYDKSGSPYILHCLEVMNNVKKWNDEELQIAAVLHDIVEDTDTTFEELEELGYSPRVIKIISYVTRADWDSYDEEIARICNDQDSIRVKMADIEHNINVLRLNIIEQKDILRIQKYHKAYLELKSSLL